MGNFKGEDLNSKNLVSSFKGSIFYSLDQKFPVKIKEPKNKFVDNDDEFPALGWCVFNNIINQYQYHMVILIH